jgi:hypothetical protein
MEAGAWCIATGCGIAGKILLFSVGVGCWSWMGPVLDQQNRNFWQKVERKGLIKYSDWVIFGFMDSVILDTKFPSQSLNAPTIPKLTSEI